MRQTVDWSKPTAAADVNALAKKLALEYATAYREGGNSRLAEYRDQDRPTFVAKEFESMVNRMPELTEYLPDLRRYLLEYPKYTFRFDVLSLLAGGGVRAQADDPHQPRRD